MPAQVDKDFAERIKGYGITTAEILYWLPDHTHILQSFICQGLDIHPRFPKLSGFLEFWEKEVEGKLHRVRVAHAQLIKPAEFSFAAGLYRHH
jgi:uncharacterized protein Usg